LVTVTPEIREMQIDYLQDEFIVVACDGLFDVLSSQQCVDYIREKLGEMPIMEQVLISFRVLNIIGSSESC